MREILDNERVCVLARYSVSTIAPPDEWIEMTRPDFAFADVDGDRLDASPRYWDPATECTVVYARPLTEPELWSDFIAGAAHSYQQHGIGAAIDTDALHRGDDTAPIRRVRQSAGSSCRWTACKGTLWGDSRMPRDRGMGRAGRGGSGAEMAADRLPFGVAEGAKTAWVADDPELSRRLTTAIARTLLHAMDLLGIQFAVATAASMCSSGG